MSIHDNVILLKMFNQGEIARYLLAQPERPEERSHKLQYVFGNGLRPQIWETFTTRFNIPRVVEFYGKFASLNEGTNSKLFMIKNIIS